VPQEVRGGRQEGFLRGIRKEGGERGSVLEKLKGGVEVRVSRP
jgi:hypothetical protein